MRDIKAIIPKTVAVVDGEERRVSVIDLMDLIEEISEAAEARRGDKGEHGECGERGPAGADGKDGKDGRDGIDGKPGRDGKDGLNGRDGTDGRNGRDGLNGLNGLPPEHEIDPARPAVRFKNPDGTWGAWIVPPAGKSGRNGGGSSWAGSAEFDAKVREIAAEVGGGSSAQTKGEATLVFGAWPGANEASIAVAGQSGITETSSVEACFAADDTTADHTAQDHRYAPAFIHLTCSTPSSGVGFTIHARSLEKMTGTFKVRWVWSA